MTCAMPRVGAAELGSIAPRRHTLVWLRTHAMPVVAVPDQRTHRDALRGWIDSGRPVIVRRRVGLERIRADEIAVGVPLPPAQGKVRIAAVIGRAAIERVAPPPTLLDALPHLPCRWQKDLRRLALDTRRMGLEVRVFGSLAWQALTGLPYVRDGSDADLLFTPGVRGHLAKVIALLERWEGDTGRRADAELGFPDDAAVSWREWRDAGDAERVLVKSTADVALRTRRELLARLPS